MAVPTHDSMKPTLASILSTLPVDPIYDLSVFDVLSVVPEAGLYLVHYTGSSSITHGFLRGIIVDVPNQRIVCDSYGYTPTVSLSRDLVVAPTGNYELLDTDGRTHSVSPNQVQFRVGYEGTILRLFKHNGKVYISTHRRIDASRSRWGGSAPFPQMYTELGGPKGEDLFPADVATSPFVYFFLLVHPNVLIATLENIQGGYIVFLGRRQMKPDPSDTRTEFGEKTEDEVFNLYPNLRRPKNLSLEEANNHLQHGYYPPQENPPLVNGVEDHRLRKGEFVMMYTLQSDGMVNLIKVQGIPYWWRTMIRDNNPNLTHRFYQLTDLAQLRVEASVDNWNSYASMFPILSDISQSPMGQPIFDPTLGTAASVRTREGRLLNIWRALLIAVPLSSQQEAHQIYATFVKDREDVIAWLRSIEESLPLHTAPPPEAQNYSARVFSIINSARQFARERRQTNRNVGRNGNIMGMRALVRDNIRNLILKEKGISLYRLVREMRN